MKLSDVNFHFVWGKILFFKNRSPLVKLFSDIAK